MSGYDQIRSFDKLLLLFALGIYVVVSRCKHLGPLTLDPTEHLEYERERVIKSEKESVCCVSSQMILIYS